MMIIVFIGNGCAVPSALVSIEAFRPLFVKLICSIQIRVYTSPEIIRSPNSFTGFFSQSCSAATFSNMAGGRGKTQPRFWMIARDSSGGIATMISGSIEKRPVNPPIALRACTPE